MSRNDEICPNFTNAPTVETVLGVQFEPLRGFRSNHYGWFWREHLEPFGFKSVSDEGLLPTYIEEFDVPKLDLTRKLGPPDTTGIRMKVRTEGKARTVQMQPDKLYLSWNRLNNRQAPRFAGVSAEFLLLYDRLAEFAANASLGPIRPNLWEVHYVNQIPLGQLWNDPRDWHRVFPTLFPSIDPSVAGLRFATYSGEWHFEIEPKKGRVHVHVAKMVMNQSTTPTLYFSLLARGKIGPQGLPDLQAGLNAGHSACIRLFLELSSSDAKTHWGLQS